MRKWLFIRMGMFHIKHMSGVPCFQFMIVSITTMNHREMSSRRYRTTTFAAGIGVPFYFLMRDTLGTSNAAAGMVLLMLPEFFFALYEKNGMHLETILTNFISVRFKRPAVRRYEVENLYERELETAAPNQKKGGILGKK